VESTTLIQDRMQGVGLGEQALTQSTPGRRGMSADHQAITQAVAVEANEELRRLAPATCITTTEDNPESRVVGTGSAIGDPGQPGQCEAIASLRFEVEAMLSMQHRLDIALAQRLTQLDQRLAQDKVIAGSLRFQPVAAVVVLQLAKKAKGVRTEPAKAPLRLI